MALAEDAAATKPNRASRLGPLCSHHQPLLPTDPRTTPNALSPLRRHHPREEPGALAAHAGICAGGDRKRSSLPRPEVALKAKIRPSHDFQIVWSTRVSNSPIIGRLIGNSQVFVDEGG